MLSEWDLVEEKLSAITTDNGANVVKAAALNGWIRQQCFGQRLHLAIENGLKDQRATRAVREKYSDPITEELLDTASFVDPRFKATYISADNAPTIQEKVKTEMEKMSKAEVCRESQITETAEPTTSSAIVRQIHWTGGGSIMYTFPL
ncbi:ubiquitin carboxyl-terminal hydrolase 29-like [Tachysurus ichikawai]